MRRPEKLFYTVRELSELAQVSEARMRALLRANNVPFGKSGQKARKGIVYVFALAEALPDFMDSLRMMGEGSWDD